MIANNTYLVMCELVQRLESISYDAGLKVFNVEDVSQLREDPIEDSDRNLWTKVINKDGDLPVRGRCLD